MIAFYLTGFRLGVKVRRGFGGYVKTFRLGWFNVAYMNHKAAHMALVAPQEGRMIVDGKLQPCNVCAEVYADFPTSTTPPSEYGDQPDDPEAGVYEREPEPGEGVEP